MRCELASELMSLRLDDRPHDEIALDEHIAVCPRCRQEWAALQRVQRLLARPTLVYPPADFTQRVMVRVAQRAAPVATNPWRLIGGWLLLLVGATFVAALLLGPLALDVWDTVSATPDGLGPLLLVHLVQEGQAIALGVLRAVLNVLSVIPTPLLLAYMLTAFLLATAWVAIVGHLHLQRSEGQV